MTASLIRQYLTMIENEDEMLTFFLETHAQYPLSRALRENHRRSTLMEGPLADKIKATANAVVARYHDVQYDLLAKATTKALNSFHDNPGVSGVLTKVLKVGKVAMQNRALLSILVGIVGTLIGLATNPAAAQQAAQQIDGVLSGDVDQMIANLEHHGIHVDMSAAGMTGLPDGLPPVIQKVAAALKAISSFEYHQGGVVQSSREIGQHLSIEADVERASSSYREVMAIKTPDGLDLLRIETVVKDGRIVGEFRTGVKADLQDYLEDLTPEQDKQVDEFIRNVTGVKQGGSLGDTLKAFAGEHAGKLALLVGAIAAGAMGVKNHISIGPKGVKVTPVERMDPNLDSPKNYVNYDELQGRPPGRGVTRR